MSFGIGTANRLDGEQACAADRFSSALQDRKVAGSVLSGRSLTPDTDVRVHTIPDAGVAEL